MKKKKTKSKKISYKKYTKIIWAIFLFFIILFSSFIFSISAGWIGELPSTTKLENPETPLATEIYSSDSVLIGKFFNENRSSVSFDELSPYIINALIATEDIRFYKHSGIDWKGVSAIPLYLIKNETRGASTITQQLAKNLFPRESFATIPEIIVRKLKEWIIAIRLEKFYTKDEIITMYLNTVDFGSNAFGIKSASKTYFSKYPIDITMDEAAILVGLLKATSYYNPRINPENSKKRRNTVLSQMLKYNYISEEEFDSTKSLPIKLSYEVSSQNIGIARYFRGHVRMYLKDWCKENNIDLYGDGLKIYTTIDSRMQKYAEASVTEHMKDLQATFYKHWKGVYNAPFGWKLSKENVEKLMRISMRRTDRYRILKATGMSWDSIYDNFQQVQKMQVFTYDGRKDTILSPYDSIFYYKWFLNPGFMAMDSKSGEIRAWVGGIDFRFFKYDHVNKKAKRQVGSTFKPFVYSTAIENGYSPCLKIPNVPTVFPDFDNWKPQNSDGKYGGMLRMEEGLAQSNNCITAWLIKRVTPEAVLEKAGAMGIDTSNIKPYPSIALGTPDISVYEMVGAFNTFTNNGVWIEPTIIRRIEDKNGNIIKRYVPREIEVFDETHNYVILNMLKKVSTMRGGTAVRLRFRYNFTNEIAAKTGTTQNNSDGWFLGAVPDLTAGCWVGAEDRSAHFRSTHLGQGANMALPIWALFMQKVYKDSTLNISKEPFEKPEEELPYEIDCKKYNSQNFQNGSNGSAF